MNTLRQIWEWWKPVGQAIGDFVGRVALSLFYFTLFVPFGLGLRWFGDPLDIKGRSRSSWLERTTPESTVQDARKLS